MEKKGQIDNGKEFLRLFPKEEGFHIKDMELRKRYQELKRNSLYQTISSDLKMELFKSYLSVKSYKSNILKGNINIDTYKCSLIRFEKALMSVAEEFKVNNNLDYLVDVIRLEKELLKLPSDTLRIFLLDIINKTGIFLQNDSHFDLSYLINLHRELEEKYYQNLQKYSLKDKRHIENTLECIKKVKSGPGNERSVKNYFKKITKLKEILV